MKMNIRSPALKGLSESNNDNLRKAVKKKMLHKETFEEAWERIFSMKNSDPDRQRLNEVRQAMESGRIGREEGSESKRFSKAEALRLYSVLEEQNRKDRLKELVESMPDNYSLVLTKDELDEAISVLKLEKRIVFDVETTGTDVYSDKIVGHVLSATSADKHYYIPTDHVDPTPQLDREYVASKLKFLYANMNIGFIAHNAKFDIQMLFNDLNIKVGNLLWDTMEAMRLLNENEPTYALKPLATKYLRDNSYTYSDLFGVVGFNEVDLKTAFAYAAKDGDITYRIYKFQRYHLAQHGQILRYFEKVEMPLMPIVSDIELEGYIIDRDHAEEYADNLRKQADEAHGRVIKHLGDINLNSPVQLKDAIEGHTERKIENTNAKQTLKPLAKDFPVIADLLEYREITKLLSTYYDALPELINPKTGRIHTRLHQNGAKTGRFSSGGGGTFNIQNQSGDARKMFIAPPGHYIVNADFSAQEVRIIASLSQEDVLLDAFSKGVDAYATLASEFFGKPYEECYKLPDGSDTQERKQMKVVLLSSMYGASKYGLANSLGISVDEAEEFRLSFFDKYRKIDRFIKDTQAFANKHGFVWIGDKLRKRRLPDAKGDMRRYDPARNRAMRQGPNARVQGEAAIQTKITMVELAKVAEERGWILWSTTHDEVQLLMPTSIGEDDIRKLDEIMTQSYLFEGVDNATDIEVQKRWGNSITAQDFLRGVPVPEADISA